MHRCTNANSKGTAVGAYDASVDIYRDELAGSYPATQLRHTEMNAIQEEVANVIRSAGVPLLTDTETPAQMIQLCRGLSKRSLGQIYGFEYMCTGNTFSIMATTEDTVTPKVAVDVRGDSTLFKTLSSNYQKSINTNWTAGNGGGGKPSSITLAAGKVYPVFVCWNDVGGFEVGIDDYDLVGGYRGVTIKAASGMTYSRRVAFVRRNDSNTAFDDCSNYGFSSSHPYVSAIKSVYSSYTLPTTETLLTMKAPTNCVGHISLNATNAADFTIEIRLGSGTTPMSIKGKAGQYINMFISLPLFPVGGALTNGGLYFTATASTVANIVLHGWDDNQASHYAG